MLLLCCSYHLNSWAQRLLYREDEEGSKHRTSCTVRSHPSSRAGFARRLKSTQGRASKDPCAFRFTVKLLRAAAAQKWVLVYRHLHSTMAAENQRDTVQYVLERNDPEVTDVHIHLDERFSDAQLARALMGNPHISQVFLHLQLQHQGAPWTALLQVLATKVNLENIHLCDVIDANRRQLQCPASMVTPFLEAIQQNNNITAVAIVEAKLSGHAVASFIENASSVTDIQLNSPELELSDTCILQKRTALNRSANLDRRLSLTKVKDSILLPILNNLSMGVQNWPLILLDWGRPKISRLSSKLLPSWSIGVSVSLALVF